MSSSLQRNLPKWTFPRRNPPPSFGRLLAGTVFLAGLSILLAFLLAGYSGPALPEYSTGDIAYADVVVPHDLVFKDEDASAAARAEAHDKALPVYRYSPEKNTERAIRLAGAFQQCRTLLQASQEIKRKPVRFSRLTGPLQTALLEKLAPVFVKPVADEAMDYLLSEGFEEHLQNGTKLLTPFYAKARALANGDEAKVPQERFRYKGPKTQSKAGAIIMLADGVEAAARTLKDRSQERLLELIRRIVSAASEDGQFSDCEITLAELERITFSFLETVSRFYHGRITYPGFEFGDKRVPVTTAKG